jgi:hypothetical protein
MKSHRVELNGEGAAEARGAALKMQAGGARLVDLADTVEAGNSLEKMLHGGLSTGPKTPRVLSEAAEPIGNTGVDRGSYSTAASSEVCHMETAGIVRGDLKQPLPVKERSRLLVATFARRSFAGMRFIAHLTPSPRLEFHARIISRRHGFPPAE